MEATFANKRFVGQKTVAKEDGILLTQYGDFPVKKGDIVFKPLKGDPEVIPSEKYFNDNYIQVEAANEKRKARPSKSPFEEQYAKALIEFNQMEMNQNEDQDYINELKGLSENKAF